MPKNPLFKGIFVITLVLFLMPTAFAGGGGGILSPHIGLSFWTIVTFVLTLVILRATAWKPIIEALQKREDTIRQDLEGAEKARKDAENMLKDYESKLADAKAEVQKINDEGRKAAEQTKADILAKAETEAKRLSDQNAQEMKLAKEKAIQEIFELTADLSVEISAKLIQKSLDEETQNKIIQDSIEEFKSVKL